MKPSTTLTITLTTTTLLLLIHLASVSATPTSTTNTNAAPLICGAKGWDTGVDSFYETHDGTYTGCAAACAKQSMCQSFAYGGGGCYVYNVPVTENFEADPDSQYVFWDEECPKELSPSSTRTTATTGRATTRSSIGSGMSSSKSSTRTSVLAKVVTTKSTTTTTSKTLTTLTTSKTTTTTPTPAHPTCPVDNTPCKSRPSHTLTDPCSQGCGCTYTEGCTGHLVPGTTLAEFANFSYSECIRACDIHQPSCMGLTWNQNGDCYLYASSLGEDYSPGGQYALRASCERPCARERVCGVSPYGEAVCV